MSGWNLTWTDYLYRYSTLSNSSRRILRSVVTKPIKRLTSAEILGDLSLEIESLRYKIVLGLIEYIFKDDNLPFPITDDLVELLDDTYGDIPMFIIDKYWDQADRTRRRYQKLDIGDSHENLLAAWLNLITTAMGSSNQKEVRREDMRSWYGGNASTPIPSTTSVQKPDLALFDYKETLLNSFLSFRAVLEHTTEGNFPKRTTNTLLKRFREIMEAQPGRRFVLGVLVSDKMFSLTLADRTGIWESGPLTISTNLKLFYRLLAGLAFAKLQHLGYDSNITSINHVPVFLKFIPFDDPASTRYYRIVGVHQVAKGVTGRGMVCFIAYGYKERKFVMIRQIWHDLDRITEYDNYTTTVRPLNEPLLPRLLAFSVPTVNNREDTDSTAFFKPETYVIGSDRILIRSLYGSTGVSVINFCCKRELLSVYINYVEAHKRLCSAGMIHQDITIDNLLIQQTPEKSLMDKAIKLDRERYTNKILDKNEFKDYIYLMRSFDENAPDNTLTTFQRIQAISQHSMPIENAIRPGLLMASDIVGYTSEHINTMAYREGLSDFKSGVHNACTGELAFMPIDLLFAQAGHLRDNEFHHTVALDMESLMYIFIWQCFHYCGPGGLENGKHPLSSWVECDPVKVAYMKIGNLGALDTFLSGIDPYFNDMKGVIEAFCDAIWPTGVGIMDPAKLYARSSSKTLHDDVIAALRSGLSVVKEPWEN